jgi:hypothetical protein
MNDFASYYSKKRDPSIDEEYDEKWQELFKFLPDDYDKEAIRSIVEACALMSNEEMFAVSVLLKQYNAWLDERVFVDGHSKCDDDWVTRRVLLYG